MENVVKVKAKGQKSRVHKAIRDWYMNECKKALEADVVYPEWPAFWGGMCQQCACATGLSMSTINRFWNGAVKPNNKPRTFGCIAAYGQRAFDTAFLQSQLWF